MRQEKVPRQNVRFLNAGMLKKNLTYYRDAPGSWRQVAKSMLPYSFSSQERTNQKAKEQNLSS